jgi:hypothetical protein
LHCGNQQKHNDRDGQIRRIAADDHSSDQRNDEGKSRRGIAATFAS